MGRCVVILAGGEAQQAVSRCVCITNKGTSGEICSLTVVQQNTLSCQIVHE